jgi:antitoxin PrlF
MEFRRRDKRVNGRSVAQKAEDCALLGFLDFLERDIAGHPERLQPVPTALVQRTSELVQNVDFDLDVAL